MINIFITYEIGLKNLVKHFVGTDDVDGLGEFINIVKYIIDSRLYYCNENKPMIHGLGIGRKIHLTWNYLEFLSKTGIFGPEWVTLMR